jgi:hypothetical protein
MTTVLGHTRTNVVLTQQNILHTMKSNSFDNLKLVDRAWLVLQFGKLLTSIEHYDVRVYLFTLNNSFIEVYKDLETHQIKKISIANYKELDKYMSRIMIGDIKKMLH